MAKVAFLGLGVMGYPDGRASQGQGRPRRHGLQPHRRQGREVGRASSAASGAATPKEAAAGPGFRHVLRRQRQRPARGDAGRRTAPSPAWPRARCSSTTPPPRPRSRASFTRQAKKRGFDFDRRAGLGRPGRRRERRADGDVRRRRGAVRARRAGDRGLCARCASCSGPPGAGQLTKMVNQICIAGLVQGLAEGIHFAKKAGLDIEAVIADDLQGRGAVLADGEPLQDHERRASSISASRSTGCARTWRSASARRARTAPTCRSPRWSISSMRKCRRWAASAGTRRACSRGWSGEIA